MKYPVKSLLLCFLMCFLGAIPIAFSQEGSTEKEDLVSKKDKILRKVSISPSIGWLHSWSDFKKDGFMPSFAQGDANELGFGLLLDYNLSKVFTISGGALFGKLQGTHDNIETANAANNDINYGKGILYKTDIVETTFPKISFNVTRLIFRDRVEFFNQASIGLIASHGLVYYNSIIYAQDKTEENLIYSRERGRTGSTTEAVTSFGGFFSFIVNDKFDVFVESTIRNVYNDKLDAWVGGDYNDKYSYTAVGFTYHIKKRDHVIKKFEIEEKNKLFEELNDSKDVEKEDENEEITEEDTSKVDTVYKTIFGKYNYDKLPASNIAIVVLDENDNPIDTIYTDENGKFQYTKLAADESVSFRPLDAESLDQSKIELYAETKDGEVVQDKKNTYIEAPTEKEVEEAVETEVKVEDKLAEGEGYYVAVGAFRGNRAYKFAEIVSEKGFSTSVIRNKRDTWNLITVDKFDNLKEALTRMREVREQGYPEAWVHIKK